MVSECSAQVLSSVPKCKKAETCLMEKICVFTKLCSGMRCSVTGCQSNVNETTIYSE